jgi:uncharacterized protein (TIGR02147 family)
MEASKSIFAFEDPVDYLNFTLRERQKDNPNFSLRAWARQLGYENPSYLSHVLKRERKLKMPLASRLATSLKLQGKPKKYFELMVLSQSSTTVEERQVYTGMLRGARPKRARAVNSLSVELFSMVSEWYHWAILDMPLLRGFRSDPAYIADRLEGLDRKTVRAAIDRLIRLGLMAYNCQGGISPREPAAHGSGRWTALGSHSLFSCTDDRKGEKGAGKAVDRREGLPRHHNLVQRRHPGKGAGDPD